MSTIERAMRKLAGEAPEPPRNVPAAPVSEGLVAEPIETTKAIDALLEPPNPETKSAPTSEPRPAAATGSTPAVRPLAEQPKPVMPDGRGLHHIELERLAAAGILVPGTATSRESEEFQQVKRRLLGNLVPGVMSNPPGPPNLVMVTSSVPGEGKTFTTLNLAMSLAMELDRTILAVDTDIIKSDMTRAFGLLGRPGLFDFLSGSVTDLSTVMVRTDVPKLTVIPAGSNRERITEKLASEAMHELTLSMAARYADRVILFDCPPVLATTGAVALARYVGQIVLVVEAGKTTHETLKHALGVLDNVPITGVVLNKSRHAQVAGGYYYYGYGYYRQS